MNATPAKQEARELIDKLSDNGTWGELVYRITARASIEHGLADAESRRLVPVDDLMTEFGITEGGITGASAAP